MRALNNPNRFGRVIGLSATGLSLAGLLACGNRATTTPQPFISYTPSTSEAPRPSVTPSASAKAAELILQLDFSNLEPGGTTCEDGNPRPCFEPIRTRPNFTDGVSDYLNKLGKIGNQACAMWPYEGFGQPREMCADETGPVIAGAGHGNDLTVVCQVEGDPVTAKRTDQNSIIWDVVRVTADHLSPAAIQRAKATNPGFGVEKDPSGAVIAVDGFVPDMWLGDHGIYDQLPMCNLQQNPAGWPLD